LKTPMLPPGKMASWRIYSLTDYVDAVLTPPTA
jgi:hypothetical protein